MFKLVTFVCLLAVSVQCKNVQSPAVPYSAAVPYVPAVPYAPQPYYPPAFRQVYAVQPKYNVQPAYVAAPGPYAPVNYRQVFVPANPAYNPYYYGYSAYPSYQPYPYQYAPAGKDGAQAPEAAAQPGWGEYLSSNFWNYVPNFPSFGVSETQQPAEAESGATSSAAESSSEAEAASPGKGDKPVAEVSKTEQKPTSDGQTAASPTASNQFGPSPFLYFGQPQFYGQQPYQPYQQAVYDPSKLNTANNGAVSSFLFYRNQPHPAAFAHPQQYDDQKYYQIPASQYGSAAVAYQKYIQSQKQPQQEQYQQGQYQQPQQDQPFQQQQSFQEPQQSFQQQQQVFQQQQDQQQYEPQQDEPSVVVDSNAPGSKSGVEGQQQQAQPKLATGPTVAVAQPQGLAFAGGGGRAGAGPIGTAIVGKNATAISGPRATAISLEAISTIDLEPVHKLTSAYVAKYSPELGVYRVAEIKAFGH